MTGIDTMRQYRYTHPMFKTINSNKTSLLPLVSLMSSLSFAVDNGVPAKAEERPYTIFIDQEISLIVPSPKTACTATLISETVALTAAHCISDYFDSNGKGNFRVALKTGRSVSTIKKLALKNIFVPMSYFRNNSSNSFSNFEEFIKMSAKKAASDFALIEFQRSVPKQLGIQTSMQFPKISRDDYSGLNTPVLYAGFGKDYLDKSFTLEDMCKKRLGKNFLSSDRTIISEAAGDDFLFQFQQLSIKNHGSIDPNDLKAPAAQIYMDAGNLVVVRSSDQTDLQITNKGDSGSALYSRESGKIIGVTSQGLDSDQGLKSTISTADGEIEYQKLAIYAATSTDEFSRFVSNAIRCNNNSSIAVLKKQGSCLSIDP